MTEFKSEAGRPIYISDNGDIVSEKSVTIKMGKKFVNVPSIHDGIEYSEDELADMLKNKEIKPTSTHKSVQLAKKAAQKRSSSLMSEETVNALEKKYAKELVKKRAEFSALEGNAAQVITPEGRARMQMDKLLEIAEDPFTDLIPGDKDKAIQSRLDSLSEEEKETMKKVLEMPKTKIKSVDADDYTATANRKRVGDVDEQTLTFAEGGLLDEGGTVDPVSGNEVPAGSTQEEVRDDIPAQLSEGEFVFPADVVRYIGLENLMKLRQKAKAGLQLMEDMGQMGNSEEAVVEDDLEYIAEIDMLIDNFDPDKEETLKFNVGGFTLPQIPSFTPPNFSQPSKGFTPQTSTSSYKAPSTFDMVYGNVQSPVQYTTEEYIGPNGERITVTLINGKPVNAPPPGYKKFDPTKAVKQAPEIKQPKVAKPTVTGDDGGRDDRDNQQSTNNMGTLGIEVAEAVSILSEVNPKLTEAFKNKPKNLQDIVVKGLIPSLITSIQYGTQSSKAIKAVEEGYGLSNFKPDSTYGKWRAGLDNVHMAASVLQTEKSARDIVSGDSDLQGSSFASDEEAQAVAEYGWGSDEHFDAIDDDFADLPTTTGGEDRGGGEQGGSPNQGDVGSTVSNTAASEDIGFG